MSYNYIITAERDCGKTTFAKALIDNGMIYKGIISLSNYDKTEYYALNIETGEKRLLLSVDGKGDEVIGKFKIIRENFAWANSYLLAIESGAVLIDEVGHLELCDKGFAPSLSALLKKDVKLYITVRTSFLNEVIEKFDIKSYSILNGSSL